MDAHREHLSTGSTSSAIDLTGSPTGLATAPSSPSLGPHAASGVARRRTSWTSFNDPFRIDIPHPGGDDTVRSFNLNEDPFSPLDSDHVTSDDDDDMQARSRYEHTTTYLTAQSGPSSASLIHPAFLDDEETEIHLASDTSHRGSSGWSVHELIDPEQTPRSRKRNSRYSTNVSPLSKTGDSLRIVSRNLRQMSLRVVNLAGIGLDDHIRLADSGDSEKPSLSPTGRDGDANDNNEREQEILPDLRKSMPLRGRTLGFMGTTNRVRLAMYRFLLWTWTEPTLLFLIIFHAIVLTIQASYSWTLSNVSDPPPQINGYFHQWEDYALFVLFIIFTLESFGRICVAGLLLDPEVPISLIFTAPFSSRADDSVNAGPISSTLSHPTSLNMQGSTQAVSVGQRLRHRYINFMRTFELRHKKIDPDVTMTMARDRPGAEISKPTMEKMFSRMQQAHTDMRDSSHNSFFSQALRSDKPDVLALPFQLIIAKSHESTQQNVPYLRHSWTRIDFLAVLCFWVTFALALTGTERGSRHIGIFRALSVLRISRLLSISSGTTTIMRSLKTARPMLAGVTYFVLFAMCLFSIVGIESFKGSLSRSCYLEPTLGEAETNLALMCGGYIDPVSLEPQGYIKADGSLGSRKGYICPLGQVCKEGPNPYGNIESFDNIFLAALQVVIISSANGWSPLMYATMNSEYFISCAFYIICIIVLNFWLINLFVAVITNTFSAIRKETKKSAFGAAPLVSMDKEHDENLAAMDGRRFVVRSNRIKELYENTRWCWVFLALASLVLQATRTVDPSTIHQVLLDKGEFGLTLAFDFEIIVRFITYLPDWRDFFRPGSNWLDSILAVGSTIIQIPVIHKSPVYPWLTVFQLARFYRVILEVPRMRPLLLAVFGNMYGLANMTLFLLLINFIAALMAVQLIRGDMSSTVAMNFGQIFNAFLAIYQIFSSENWPTVLYDTAQAEQPVQQSVVVILFLSGWLLFANFIVLQMFIAVINENFQVAEEAKKGRQASHYWAAQQPEKSQATWLRKLNPYTWLDPSPKAIAVENLPSNLVLPMQKALVQDYGMPRREGSLKKASTIRKGPGHYTSRSINLLQNIFVGEQFSDDFQLSTLRNPRRDTAMSPGSIGEEMENHLDMLATINTEAVAAEDLNDTLHERRAQKADFIRDHPSYDKTFWLFSQKNFIRRTCQKLVKPASGERIFGAHHSRLAHPIFQLGLLLTVIAAIVIESIATPIYRRNYYQKHGLLRGSWFDVAEGAFGATLLVEFVIKIVADGFIFTPNAYVRSVWNCLDFLVLIGVIINITTGLIFVGGLSRLTRSLKALRVLRLITLIDMMRTTFESLIILGALRIVDAAVLAILYMIPYAVWGLNIFSGLMNTCNDGNSTGEGDCTNEYVYSLPSTNNAFGFLAPRVWSNPSPSTTFSFDTFRSSLLILFEIVSLEGWIDVMGVATSITGPGQQPQTNASQVNALFFIIYNLLGGVVILTLFVSIIIGNFSARTGAAFLTQPQTEWIDLQKLIRRQRPSKRPKARPDSRIRAWCYDRAVRKRGWWSRLMTLLYVIHVLALMTQTYTDQRTMDDIRNDFFLIVSAVHMLDVTIRLYGLGWRSFRYNGWNIYDMVVGVGSFVTTLLVRQSPTPSSAATLQKLFIVGIAFKLVQRTDSLNKLFKTSISSLPVILSLVALWFILFLFFAVMFVEVFSLTKWGSGENQQQNYSTMSSALVMLAFMSTGEGWNQYMHDYTVAYPRCTNASASDKDSDCGSVGWAFSLFIAWNLLSMYIFVNLFTGVVVENFSYVFQSGGTKSITRDEMRAFKKVWAEFANPKTQYLERSRFVPFFAKLGGIFEVRIYPARYSIQSLIAASSADDGDLSPRAVMGIDLDKLNRTLNSIDYNTIKSKKAMYSRLYHEANIIHHSGRGISFTDMLLLLAHHKLIVDREALVLKDLVVRTETNKLVTDLVNLDRVRSLMKMIIYRRRFKEHLRRKYEHEIPSIVVDAFPSTPPSTSRDITSAGRPSTSVYSIQDSPTPTFGDSRSFEVSIDLDSSIRSGPGLHRGRRTGDMAASADFGPLHRDSLSVGRMSISDDANDILSSMQNSVWGDLLIEAAEEEEKS